MLNFVITVTYKNSNQVRHFNEADMTVALARCQSQARLSVVRKVELSVILCVFNGPK